MKELVLITYCLIFSFDSSAKKYRRKKDAPIFKTSLQTTIMNQVNEVGDPQVQSSIRYLTSGYTTLPSNGKFTGFLAKSLSSPTTNCSFQNQAFTETKRDGLPSFIIDRLKERLKKMESPGEKYFLIIFGYEGKGNKAQDSHTFASYIKISNDGQVTTSSISWLPDDYTENEKICVFDNIAEAAKFEILGNPCKPVKGKNYTLLQTLAWAKKNKRKLAYWGPYNISKSLYDLGIARVSQLNNGKMKYLADDRAYRGTEIYGDAFDNGVDTVNCLHAVSDIFFGSEQKDYSLFENMANRPWGISGTVKVVDHIMYTGQSGYFKEKRFSAKDRFIIESFDKDISPVYTIK